MSVISDRDPTVVRDASVRDAADADVICELAGSCQLVPDADTSTGFLLAALTAAGYAELLTDSEFALVAERDGAAVGFVIVMAFDGSAEAHAMGVDRTGWALIGQVGVSAQCRRSGVGRALYAAVLDRCVRRPVIATVSLAPHHNAASVAFHQQLGFAFAGELTVADGSYRTGVFVARPPDR